MLWAGFSRMGINSTPLESVKTLLERFEILPIFSNFLEMLFELEIHIKSYTPKE